MCMNELKRKRKELGLTQEVVARACGVSRRTYQTYEETNIQNDTYNQIMAKLEEMGITDNSNFILSVKGIKITCREIFRKYPEVKCAYLYGSYARGEATGKSDVDILVVCHKMGFSFFGMAGELEDALHKTIDLQTHRQIAGDDNIIESILTEGIKIYG